MNYRPKPRDAGVDRKAAIRAGQGVLGRRCGPDAKEQE
jgi:hypothetical protein